VHCAGQTCLKVNFSDLILVDPGVKSTEPTTATVIDSAINDRTCCRLNVRLVLADCTAAQYDWLLLQ